MSEGVKSPAGAVRAQSTSRTGADETRMPRIEATNDFVIKFANVNGSGSASANRLFAR